MWGAPPLYSATAEPQTASPGAAGEPAQPAPAQPATGPSASPPVPAPSVTAPPAAGPPPDDGTAASRSGNRKAIAIALGAGVVVLAALIAFVAVGSPGGSAGAEATVDECSIAQDGTLVASGTIVPDDDVDTIIEVRFEDRATGTEVDRDAIEVAGAADEMIDWTAGGQAGAEVDRVTCVLGPLE